MTTPAKLNEYSQAEEPARVLLEQLGWTYVPREALAAERSEEREVLLKGRLRAALLRLNEWLTDEQAKRVIFELEHVNEVGIARNQKLHEYLTFGLPLTVNTTHGQDSRNVRFFDFEHPESGLNELGSVDICCNRCAGPFHVSKCRKALMALNRSDKSRIPSLFPRNDPQQRNVNS